MKKLNGHFDVILDAISANHDFTDYLNLLDLDGKLLVVGLPMEDPKVSPFSLVGKRRSVTGSMIGGIKETQEMLMNFDAATTHTNTHTHTHTHTHTQTTECH